MKEALIFLHIPKTAGTTFAFILQRNFPRSRIASIYPGIGLSEQEFGALPEARRSGFDCVMGHFDFGLHRLLPRPSTYVTFLRDPVRHVLSRYRHIRSSRWHPLHYMARGGASIEEFLGRLPDNYQTRALCGVEIVPGRPHPVLTGRHLEQAKTNLQEHFAVVGITERFDESVLLARRRCRLADIRYARRNVRERGRGQAPLEERERRAIDETTRLDRALYDWAARRLEGSISEIGPEFEPELARFRQANARYSRLAGPLKVLAEGTLHRIRLVRAAARRLRRRQT